MNKNNTNIYLLSQLDYIKILIEEHKYKEGFNKMKLLQNDIKNFYKKEKQIYTQNERQQRSK